jgi:hypothetical protein
MKQKLLRAVEEARAHESELEAYCVDEPADPDGRWHVKDQLSHLAWWRSRSAANIDAVRPGGERPPAVVGEDNEQNAVVYAETKDRPAAEVKRDVATSWTALRSALEASSEDDLAKPHPDYPENQVWEAVPGMTGHLSAHLMSWYMDEGDVDRAEAVARWGYDLECSFVPEGEKRADATYNLACFYSRAGRVDEAVPLLRDSIRYKPELGKWALEDHDLDPIRDEPAVRDLLTGV